MTRYDIINEFIEQRNYKYFLEIGTASGETYRNVNAQVRISVDPAHETMATYRMTSDEFFEKTRFVGTQESDMLFDIVFIDGLHTCEQAYADIMNALGVLIPGGVIIIHDCLPTSEKMQEHSDHYPGGIWTGDVWKAFVKVRRDCRYLMYTIDTDFGCGILDTRIRVKPGDVPKLPINMHQMSYDDFLMHRNEWMNVKERIQYG